MFLETYHAHRVLAFASLQEASFLFRTTLGKTHECPPSFVVMIEPAARNVVNKVVIRVVRGDDPSVPFFPFLSYKSTCLNFNISDFIAFYSHVSTAINVNSKRRMEIAWYACQSALMVLAYLRAGLHTSYTYLALTPS